MHPGQIEIIKENIVTPMFETLVEEYDKLPKHASISIDCAIDAPSLELVINSMLSERSEYPEKVHVI